MKINNRTKSAAGAGCAMAASDPRSKRHPHWPVRLLLCVVALALLIAPRIVTGTAFGALDAETVAAPRVQAVETPGASFPGSAFFFAEGAFAPAPGSTGLDSADIFVLQRVTAAAPISFIGATAIDRYRAVNCLTSAIYYEAANEPDDGQRAVAQVVLNRVRNPAWPGSVCGVIYQGSERADMKCQFTFSCDGAMTRIPAPDKWARARRVALRSLAGDVFAPVGMATHYHTLAVHPNWGGVEPVAVVGAHIFYVMSGERGMPQAFRASYSGREIIAGPSPRQVVPALLVPEAMPVDVPARPVLDGKGSAQDWAPPHIATQGRGTDLPESTIKPEYRDSGRPLT
ncbi:MAG: cell wall hydrolase [Sphingobium sp.]